MWTLVTTYELRMLQIEKDFNYNSLRVENKWCLEFQVVFERQCKIINKY